MEEDYYGVFRPVEVWSMVRLGHPALLCPLVRDRGRMAPFYTAKPRNTHPVCSLASYYFVTMLCVPLRVDLEMSSHSS
jgi:hypothetical protein